MNLPQELPEILRQMGVKEIVLHTENELFAQSPLIGFRCKCTPKGLLIEAVILHQAYSNKALLWHLINVNSLYAPFGQFYVSASKEIVLGCVLPWESVWNAYKERIIFEMLCCAESYYSLLNRDVIELPFDEKQLPPDWSDLIKNGFHWSKNITMMDRNTATYMLERLLNDAFVPQFQVIRMNDYEFALADEWITSLTLLPMPHVRRYAHITDWFLGFKTEIGILNHTDTSLLIKINRKNSDNFGTSVVLNYINNRPILCLQSELVADCIRQPSLIAYILAHHAAYAHELYNEMKDFYKISYIVSN